MAVYLTMLAVSLLFANYAQNTRRYPKLTGSYRILAVLSSIPFILVTVLRYEVGIDWTSIYAPHYYYINHGIKNFSEAGFNMLNKILYQVTPEPWILFALVGFATMVFFFLAFYRLSDQYTISILVFFLMSYYFQSLNQIRQMLAMAIFLFAVRYIFQRRFIPYIICILIGATIHTSSLIYLPIYFLFNLKTTFKKCVVFFCLCVLSLPILSKVVIPIVLHTKYGWYLHSMFSGAGFYKLGFLVMMIYMGLHLIHLNTNEQNGIYDKEYCFMNNMILLSTISLLFSAVLPQVSRISDGLSIICVFSVPRILKTEKNKNALAIFIYLFFSVCLVKFGYDTFINQWHGALPYHTIFQKITL